MKRRFRKLVLLSLLAAGSLSPAADNAERVRTISSNLICVCSCKQLLGACNHFNCPSSGPMLADLQKQIDAGKSDEAVMAYFVEKYGETVLAAPPVSGFNLTAWMMPFVALAIGAIAAVYCVRRFRSRWATNPVADETLAKYQDKVEEELKKFTPED